MYYLNHSLAFGKLAKGSPSLGMNDTKNILNSFSFFPDESKGSPTHSLSLFGR